MNRDDARKREDLWPGLRGCIDEMVDSGSRTQRRGLAKAGVHRALR